MSEYEERKKKQPDQVMRYHNTFDPKYRMAGFRPREDAEKLDELRKTMGEKPEDKRLLTRYLVARDAGLLQIELGKVKEELEQAGYRDVKKAVDKDLKERIRGILRGRK